MTDAECLQSDCSSSLLLLTESYNKIFFFFFSPLSCFCCFSLFRSGAFILINLLPDDSCVAMRFTRKYSAHHRRSRNALSLFALWQAMTFNQVIQTGPDEEGGDDKAVTAMGILNTIDTLLSVVEDHKEVSIIATVAAAHMYTPPG